MHEVIPALNISLTLARRGARKKQTNCSPDAEALLLLIDFPAISSG